MKNDEIFLFIFYFMLHFFLAHPVYSSIDPVGNSASDKPDLLMARSSQPSQSHHQPHHQIDPLADPYHPGAMAPELAQGAAAAASAQSSLDALDISLDDDLLLEVCVWLFI